MEIELDRLKTSRGELIWFFTSDEEVMGLHGQGYGDTGASVWDALRIQNAHLSKFHWSHRHDVQRRARVLDAVLSLTPSQRQDLTAVYQPIGGGRVSWRTVRIFTDHSRPMLGLVVQTKAVQLAYQRRLLKQQKIEEDSVNWDALPRLSPIEALKWVEDLVSILKIESKMCHLLPKGHCLEAAMKEAMTREEAAVVAYTQINANYVQQHREERAMDRSRLIEEAMRMLRRGST